MELHSDLWLDQPDAHERIEERLGRGLLTAEEAGLLHGFVDDGYIKLRVAVDEQFSRGFDDEVSRIWEERPKDLAISLFDGPAAISLSTSASRGVNSSGSGDSEAAVGSAPSRGR